MKYNKIVTYKQQEFKYMSTTSNLDLQHFYPKELKITSVGETQDELWLYMCSQSKSCVFRFLWINSEIT